MFLEFLYKKKMADNSEKMSYHIGEAKGQAQVHYTLPTFQYFIKLHIFGSTSYFVSEICYKI